jgi:hypothetical protein
LEKLASNNNPKDLALSILKYSAELEDTAPEESLKLLAIAEGIIEDYKTAGLWDFIKRGPEDRQEQKAPAVPLA